MAEVSNSTLFQIDTGILPTNACVVILRTDWNAGIVGELENGCRRILEQHGVIVKLSMFLVLLNLHLLHASCGIFTNTVMINLMRS